jgi:glycosyltransferase involved in cell wall biosynthesis
LAQRPKILHVLHSSAIGGGPVSVGILALGSRSEFEPIVVSSGEGDLPGKLEQARIEFHALPLATKVSFLRSIARLARLIRSVQPDVIHLHGHFAGSLGQIAVVLAGRPPTVYTVRWPAYLSDKNLYTRVRNWFVEWLSCAAANRVVAISEHDRATLIKRRLCSAGKLSMIYNAAAAIPAAPIDQPDRDGQVTIGFVGRLVDQKGCDDLIAAFELLGDDRARTRLVIIGDGPQRPELEMQVRSAGLSGSVEFLGFRSDATALMAGMHIVAVPSRFEPFGIVAVEAMALGRPVVASAVGGLTESIKDGVTGSLVPAGDPHRLAEALSALIRSPQTRVDMGRAGRARVLEVFAPDRVVDAYAGLYRDLITH